MKSELKFLEDIYYSLGFRALGNAFYTAINNGLISFLGFFAFSFLCICDFTKFLYNNIMKIEKKLVKTQVHENSNAPPEIMPTNYFAVHVLSTT